MPPSTHPTSNNNRDRNIEDLDDLGDDLDDLDDADEDEDEVGYEDEYEPDDTLYADDDTDDDPTRNKGGAGDAGDGEGNSEGSDYATRHSTTRQVTEDYWDTYITEGRQPESSAEERLVRSYLPLAVRTIERVHGRFFNADEHDVHSNAYLGLMLAIRSYDPSHGYSFEKWAVNTMWNQIIEGQRGVDWLPKHRRTSMKRVTAAIAELAHRGIVSPTNDQIADEAILTIKQVERARHDLVTSRVDSIDHLAEISNNGVDAALTPAARAANGESVISILHLNDGLAAHYPDAVRMLPDRPRQVLAMYVYGGYAFKEIGQVLSVSESRVSQIFSEIGTRLRKNMETLAAT